MTDHANPADPARPRRAPGRAGMFIVLGLLLAGLGAYVIKLKAWADKKQPTNAELSVLSRVTEFSLTDQSGRTVTLEDLKGKVWVADFMFTRCGTICPKMSTHMAELARHFTGRDDVRFVSITSDPEYDTPERLYDYGEIYQADHRQWLFLTGAEDVTHRLATEGFLIGNTPGKPEHHSARFVLVDREGQVRATVLGTDAGTVEKLRGLIDRLLADGRS